MSFQNIILITITSYGIIQLLLAILFWYMHLDHLKSHPIYRIRHPIFWQICLYVGSVQITLRGLLTFLRLNYHITPQVFHLLNPFFVMLLGFAFPFGRMITLWYALKLQRYEQRKLIEKHLLNEKIRSSVMENTIPWLYNHSTFFGQPQHIFVAIESILFIGYIIVTILSITSPNHGIARNVLCVILLLCLFSITYLIISIWCCVTNKNIPNDNDNINYTGLKFRDDFKFRLELTLIFVLMITMTLLRSWISIKFKTEHTSDTSEFGLVLNAIFSLLTQSIIFIIQTVTPYYTFKRNQQTLIKSNCGNRKNGIQIVSLQNILAHKYGFFLFLDHVMQELSLENLSCVIAIYQYKYVNDVHIHTKSQLRAHLNGKLKTNTEKTTSAFDITQIDQSIQLQTPVSSMSTTESLQFSSMAYYSKILSKMPWMELPLILNTDHENNNTKFFVANQIFDKYIDRKSYCSVNISANTFEYIFDTLNALKLWKINDVEMNEIKDDGNVVSNNCHINIPPIIVPPNTTMNNNDSKIAIGDIKTHAEWNEKLLTLFDIALRDLFSNLEDCMTRFRATPQFIQLISSN